MEKNIEGASANLAPFLVDLDNYPHDDYEACQDDGVPEGELEECCSGCMDCLGLSWRDFM